MIFIIKTLILYFFILFYVKKVVLFFLIFVKLKIMVYLQKILYLSFRERNIYFGFNKSDF